MMLYDRGRVLVLRPLVDTTVGDVQGWSSTSCIQFRCWHRLGHRPVMQSKMAADCLCQIQNSS